MKINLYSMISSGEIAIQPNCKNANGNRYNRNESNLDTATGVAPKRGMVVPFTPLAMAFDDVRYYVDMPAVRIDIQSRDY